MSGEALYNFMDPIARVWGGACEPAPVCGYQGQRGMRETKEHACRESKDKAKEELD